MDIDVNYKNKKRYKTAKYPMHFIDFKLTAMTTYPHPVSNVITKLAFATEEIYLRSQAQR